MPDNASRIARMRERLAVLQPEALEIHDESHRHVGHAGAQDGRGHFACTIVSHVFEGKSMLDCHRMVYDALGDMMLHDIHALSIRALVSNQIDKR